MSETYGGLKVLVDASVLEATEERLFPESRNRSRRVRKKLLKRFGGEFRLVPCIWRTPTTLIFHPAKYAEFRATVLRSPTDTAAEE